MGTVFWLIGIVAALICGWLFASNIEGKILLRLVIAGTFTVSVALMDFAIALRNPEVMMAWNGIIAIIGAVIVGAILTVAAGYFARVGYEAPEKAFYVIASILLLVGAFITCPSVVHAVLAAGSC